MCVCIIVNHNCPIYRAVCSCRPGWWERGALESVYAFQSDLMCLIWSHVYTHTHTLNGNMPHGNLISLGSRAPRNDASSLNGISELFSKCHPETKPLCIYADVGRSLTKSGLDHSVVYIIKSALESWSSHCKEVVTHRGSHVLLTHSFISLYILYIGYIGLTIYYSLLAWSQYGYTLLGANNMAILYLGLTIWLYFTLG